MTGRQKPYFPWNLSGYSLSNASKWLVMTLKKGELSGSRGR